MSGSTCRLTRPNVFLEFTIKIEVNNTSDVIWKGKIRGVICNIS